MYRDLPKECRQFKNDTSWNEIKLFDHYGETVSSNGAMRQHDCTAKEMCIVVMQHQSKNNHIDCIVSCEDTVDSFEEKTSHYLKNNFEYQEANRNAEY